MERVRSAWLGKAWTAVVFGIRPYLFAVDSLLVDGVLTERGNGAAHRRNATSTDRRLAQQHKFLLCDVEEALQGRGISVVQPSTSLCVVVTAITVGAPGMLVEGVKSGKISLWPHEATRNEAATSS